MTASPSRPKLRPSLRPAVRLAAASVLLAGCATNAPAASVTTETGPAPSPSIAPTPIAQPSPSPVAELDGLLVFNAETPDGLQLFTMRPDGRDRRQITHVEGDAVAAEWAPDGTRITFQVNAEDECSIAFVDPDGGNLTILPRGEGTCEAEPTFTPDGIRIVFGATDPVSGNDALWSMKTNGTDRREIGFGVGTAWAPAVSPDGATVSAAGWNLLEGDDQYEGVYTMGIDGTNPRWATPFWTTFLPHVWSPDGEWLVVSDNVEPGTANIAAVRSDGSSVSDPTFLTTYRREDQRAAVQSYSPDGDWILYRLREYDQWALFVMRPDGSEAQPISAFSTFYPDEIDWGPAAGN